MDYLTQLPVTVKNQWVSFSFWTEQKIGETQRPLRTISTYLDCRFRHLLKDEHQVSGQLKQTQVHASFFSTFQFCGQFSYFIFILTLQRSSDVIKEKIPPPYHTSQKTPGRPGSYTPQEESFTSWVTWEETLKMSLPLRRCQVIFSFQTILPCFQEHCSNYPMVSSNVQAEGAERGSSIQGQAGRPSIYSCVGTC